MSTAPPPPASRFGRQTRAAVVAVLAISGLVAAGCSAEPREHDERGEHAALETTTAESEPASSSRGDASPSTQTAKPEPLPTVAVVPPETPDAAAPDRSPAFMKSPRRLATRSVEAKAKAPNNAMVPRSAADAVSPNPAELPPRAATSDTAESRATATAPPVVATAPPVEATSPPVDRGPFESLPAGATRDATDRYAKIPVYYATDRQRASLPLSAYALEGNRDAVVLLAGSAIVFLALALFNLVRRRVPAASAFGAIAFAASLGLTATIWSGTAAIEKHGVTYTGQRGSLVKGLCEVTVPDTHRRGRVERPSWLRFEFREDQREHIVLTRATELSDDRFYDRLGETIALSPENDLLVFVHGYNVDFESAVRRTAQLAVDLPFEGVPVCYSWPSRGNVLSYTIDEANAAWTQSHLRAFLLELADRSGARAINVVAHSMGNRPTTGALVDIGWKQHANPDAAPTKLLDRLVLAAPDVDADLFRKDLAPALSRVADHVTLYASSDDRALVASKQVHGYPRAGESGDGIVVVPGIETVDVSGIDLSLLGHSYYGDSPSMLQELYELLRIGLPAAQRRLLRPRPLGDLTYWQLVPAAGEQQRAAFGVESGRR